MSVLIKGMDMPNNCRECKLTFDDTVDESYWFMRCVWSGHIVEDHGLLPNCPLVSVPTPHGRLIDADAIPIHLFAVDNAPTVIESEE